MCIGRPKMPKAPETTSETPTFRMSNWLKSRLAAGSPTDLNRSVTIAQAPPNVGMP